LQQRSAACPGRPARMRCIGRLSFNSVYPHGSRLARSARIGNGVSGRFSVACSHPFLLKSSCACSASRRRAERQGSSSSYFSSSSHLVAGIHPQVPAVRARHSSNMCTSSSGAAAAFPAGRPRRRIAPTSRRTRRPLQVRPATTKHAGHWRSAAQHDCFAVGSPGVSFPMRCRRAPPVRSSCNGVPADAPRGSDRPQPAPHAWPGARTRTLAGRFHHSAHCSRPAPCCEPDLQSRESTRPLGAVAKIPATHTSAAHSAQQHVLHEASRGESKPAAH